jgi:hypothetical protein
VSGALGQTVHPAVVKALAALQMVSALEPSQILTGAQWLHVVHARNELEGHVDEAQALADDRAYAAAKDNGRLQRSIQHRALLLQIREGGAS